MALVNKIITYDHVEFGTSLLARNSKTVDTESDALEHFFSHAPAIDAITPDLPVVAAQYSVAAGADEDIDLTSLPLDQIAAQVTTGAKWYLLALYNDSDNDFTVGGAAATQCLAFTTTGAALATLPAGHIIYRWTPSGVILAGANNLRVSNAGGDTATFWLIAVLKTS